MTGQRGRQRARARLARAALALNVVAAGQWAGAQGVPAAQLPAAPQPADVGSTVGSATGQSANAPARFDRLFGRNALHYRQYTLPDMSFEDSPGDARRAALLVTDGVIRLSIADAVALAVENNLDVESVRLLNPAGRADLARARSGQLLRNLQLATDVGPSTANGVLPVASPFGFEGVGSPQGGVLSGLTVQLYGSQILNTEPVLFAGGQFRHQELPLSNSTVTGTNFLDQNTADYTVGVRKGYFTGTTLTGGFEALRISQNAPNDTITPFLQGDAYLRVDQHLLQGFGRQTNLRAVHIAVNNQRIGDLTFRQQMILTVSQVLGLYYDLLEFQDEKRVLEDSIGRSRTRLEQNRKLLDFGTVGQAEVLAAELAVRNGEQQIVDAQAQIDAQEATLKSVLTHAGLDNPQIAAAHIVLLDRFNAAAVAAVAEESPTVAADRAVRQRLELQQAGLALTNKHLSMLGTRNALRPTFDVYLQVQGNALAGQINRLGNTAALNSLNPVFVGGLGTVFSQIGQGSYPDYQAGFQLNLPLINRAAQADYARDQVDLRQQEIGQQSLRNGIRLQAMKAALALKQAREQYALAVQTRELLTKSVATEQKLFDFGTSTPARLGDVQLQLEQAQIREITAVDTLARATVNLQAVLNETLERNGVVLEGAAAAK